MAVREIKFRRVSGRQIELLWEYLNSHRDIAAAYNRSLESKAYTGSKWREVADLLNSQGEGAYKDWRGWSKYWVDYKAKLKKKAAVISSAQTRTGGGPPIQPLSLMETKFLEILGEDYGQGLSGVRVEPFTQPSISTATGSLEDSPASQSILIREQEMPIQSTQITPPRFRTPIPECAAVTMGRSPRRRRRRRGEPPMSQEAARRALVKSSQMKTDAAMRSSHALEMIAQGIAELSQKLSDINNSLHNIER